MTIRPDRLRYRRRAVTAACAAACLTFAIPASITSAQPSSISAQRAEVARLEAQLADLDAKAARAAEAYNGAKWRQSEIEKRIVINTQRTTDTTRRLKRSQTLLSERLRGMYANPTPSLVEVVASTGSVASAVDGAELLERVGERDGAVVRDVRSDLDNLRAMRAALLKDRAQVEREVEEAARRKAEVEAILVERQQVLDGARGELRRLIAAEEARKRREAEAARQRALAAQRAIAQAQERVAPSSSPSAPSSVPVAAPGSGAGNAAVVGIAMQYLGVPYVWGGESPSGFDCSGLATYVYRQIGKSVPHYTGAAWAAFPKVASGDLQPGDLVFFYSDLHHMGIYIGNGQFIHAPSTGDVVKISSLAERAGTYAGAVRP